MPLSTKAIFGKRVLTQLSASDYVDWAGEMLMQGYDSHHLCILAGLDNSTSFYEADERFLRAARELGFDVPDSEKAVRLYACETAQQIIEGQLTGHEGVRSLSKICRDTTYHPDFIAWYYLDEAWDFMMAGDPPYTYQSATLENYDEVARQEARNFIAAMRARYAI